VAGLLFGLFGFGAFYLSLALFLEPLGIAAFAIAIAAAVVMQAATLRNHRRVRLAEPHRTRQTLQILECHAIGPARFRIPPRRTSA